MITLYGANGTHPNLSGRFAIIEYHLWDTYEEPWGAARAQGFYNAIFLGTPCFVYDGLWDAWPIDSYHNKFLNRVNVPTTVTVELGAVETSPNRYETTVRTCVEPDGNTENLRIYTVVVEDNWPNYPSYSRNTFRLAAPTADLTLAPGECGDVTNLLIAFPETEQSNLKIIAWAQERSSTWPADVFQAVMDAWPFEALPPDEITGDLNGDGFVNAADLALLLGNWGPVDPCTTTIPADLNEDCMVDAADLALLLGNWTS